MVRLHALELIPDEAGRALDVLTGRGRALTLTTLRRWDPLAEQVSTVAGDR